MAAPNTVTTPHPLYGGGSGDGSFLGRSSSDTIGFYQDPYNTTATAAQRTGNAQSAVNTTTGLGELTVYGANFSTVSVTSGTSAEQGATTAQFIAGSVIGVNKPEHTTGVGLIGYRVSSGVLDLNFANVSTTAIVPLSTGVYQIAEFHASSGITTTVTIGAPAAVSASTTAEITLTVPGAMPGMVAFVNKPTTQAGLGIGNLRITAPNTVALQYTNVATSGAITPTSSEVYSFAFVPTLMAASPVVVYTVPASLITASTAVSSQVETTTGVMNLVAGDIAIGASKPTAQPTLSIANYRISAAGALAIAMQAGTTGAVPTSSEAWSIAVFRQPQSAAVFVTTAALNATSVPATTTIEQTTTVSGVVAGSFAWVNKPTHTPSISVVNVRVSAANTLAVTYQNNASTATAVPAETYIVGWTGVATPSAPTSSSGAYSIMAQPAQSQGVTLANELRAALVGTNFIAGQ